MAPKRPSPSDQPPSVSTSEDDVEENQPTPIQSSLKKPNHNNQADEDEDASAEDDEENDESGSDSDSDDDNEPVKHLIAPRNVDVKPLSSKPMVIDTPKSPLSSKPMVIDTPKSKKPTSATAAKRSLETDTNDKDSKRDKKKKKIADIEEKDDHTEDTENKSGEEKKLFQRIFSEKDEIGVLNCLLEFKKKGNHITKNGLSEFFDFVKGSLHVEANSSQLINKVQRLHKKYRKNVKRAEKQPGVVDPTFSNPHELKSYFLSKEIWADQVALKKSKNKIESNGVAIPNPKKKMLVVPAISPKVDPKEVDYATGSQYQYLDQSVKPQNYLSLPMPPAYLGEIAAKKGWDMCGSSKALAFDQRWKALIIKETEVYLERVALVQEQIKWMLDLQKSSES
ncbi:Dna-binding storekeeper protein-related transcriptional regulator, partial [Thalictrum thalictroides]